MRGGRAAAIRHRRSGTYRAFLDIRVDEVRRDAAALLTNIRLSKGGDHDETRHRFEESGAGALTLWASDGRDRRRRHAIPGADQEGEFLRVGISIAELPT